MEQNFNKKVLGFIGASVILGSWYIDFKQNSLLLPQNERINFCIDQERTDCLNDHLESKFEAYLISDSTPSVASSIAGTISIHLI